MKIKQQHQPIFCVYTFLFLAFFTVTKSISSTENKKETWLTVFVHGIMSIQPHLTSENFFKFFKDDIKNTPYERAVFYIRQDPFFFKNQAMQKFGLHAIDITKTNATAAIANIYENITHLVQPQTENHYYTFGWSGLLSRKERYIEAEHLYRQLIIETKKFQVQGIEPKIRLIGYSHGANTCLNIAAIRRDKYPENSLLSIQELILLGGPIQHETDYLVNDKIFKRVYNCFSQKDRIQPIDFFSLHRIFSGKRLKNRLSFCVSEKVRQIRFEINRLRHTDQCFKQNYIKTTNNFCIPGMISGKHSLLRDMSPGHIELWFFSWSPRHYRENFILKPLPLLVFLPYIIHYVEKHIDAFITPKTIVADIRPDHDLLLLKQGKCNQSVFIESFISNKKRKQLEIIAEKARPDNYSQKAYDQHLYDAIDKAYRDFYCPGNIPQTKHEKIKHRRMRKRPIAPAKPKKSIITIESA